MLKIIKKIKKNFCHFNTRLATFPDLHLTKCYLVGNVTHHKPSPGLHPGLFTLKPDGFLS